MIDILDEHEEKIRNELIWLNYKVAIIVTRQCMTGHLLTRPHGIEKLHETVDRLLESIDLAANNKLAQKTIFPNNGFAAEVDFKVDLVIKMLCKEYPELTDFFKDSVNDHYVF
jgi:hypothetical protein